MNDPVRFGYIGCGHIAQHVHLPNFAALAAAGECRFLALAEARPDLGERVAVHGKADGGQRGAGRGHRGGRARGRRAA